MKKWHDNEHSPRSFNVASAFEVALINLGLVDWDEQWDIDDTEKYGIRWELYKLIKQKGLEKVYDGERGIRGGAEGETIFDHSGLEGKSVKFNSRPGSSERPDE